MLSSEKYMAFLGWGTNFDWITATGAKQAIYRADIDKISGWRVHVQYIDKQIHLKDIIEGQKHDDVLKVIKSKKSRYE